MYPHMDMTIHHRIIAPRDNTCYVLFNQLGYHLHKSWSVFFCDEHLRALDDADNVLFLSRPPQSLLGGFALISLFVTYLVLNGNGVKDGLTFFAPVAESLSRAYYTLLTISIVSLTIKMARCGHKLVVFRAVRAAVP